MTPAANTQEAGAASQSPDVTKAAAAVGQSPVASEATETQAGSMRAYFTEGEMLPWKGRWFRIHLNATTKKIELEMVKPTAASQKRFARAERWKLQHPRAAAPRA
jgi:hypothetical protein